MSGIFLDTHVLVWSLEGSRRLGRQARAAITRASARDAIFVCTVSFFEIARLVDLGRLKLSMDIEPWRGKVLDFGVSEVAPMGIDAIQAARLPSLAGDPFDRMILATAMRLAATFLTADARLLDWPGPLPRHDATQ